ncbi:TetR/AcrR family transcriptional regulator [Rouxiella badensis]|uniref:TetR/AcrR family transcriptional regulator n=1 Tax=Rouxiella badensis TaxID=1646377 RepID=UPI001B419B50|nr:TetR/AcrR family transcriptional regulator [Rouxiella badensis]MCC3746501.1 TetR/AcrR family transcriptional regulator; helix-turn-helix transcriptional regulator [Rouxiella badensis]WAT09840.1 TetR/AcrR family transcriptional regulator [Rouxiella badensis]
MQNKTSSPAKESAPAKGVSLSKGERTHANLRRHAAAEFARLGYHNTKVSDIVKATGVSQPTFYCYFESKEMAYEDLMTEFRSRLETLTLTFLIEGEAHAEEVFDRVALSFQQLLDFLAEDPDLTQIGFFQPPGCTATKAGLAELIGQNIAKEQKNGLYRKDISATQMGQCFVGMLDQMARIPGDAQKRKELSLGCATLLCEDIRSGCQPENKR